MSPPKRFFDLFWTVLGLLFLWPLFLLVAAAIKLEDGGPIFFRQLRVGLHGRPFRIWKFRTMRPEAESCGPSITTSADTRVTRVGRFLRKYKVDELAQLINVLTGEMSLVGPRPEVQRYVDRYPVEMRRVLEFVPGITDPASIAFRNEERLLASAPDPERAYVETIMLEKLRLNLEFSGRASIMQDFFVILRTFACLVHPPRDR